MGTSLLLPMMVSLLSFTPGYGGHLDPGAFPINTSAGDQFDPHVDGDLAAYSNDATHQIHWFRFSDESHGYIPWNLFTSDVLSDVDNERIVFTRLTPQGPIVVLYEVDSASEYELAPAPNTSHFGIAIGGDTAAFVDFTADPINGEVVILDLQNHSTLQVTFDSLYQQNVAVAPDGNVVVWEQCSTGSSCSIGYARKNDGVWSTGLVSSNFLRDSNPDTNGTLVVFQRDDPFVPGSADLVVVNLQTFTEDVVELGENQYNPSIRGEFIAFESRETGVFFGDLFILNFLTRTYYRVTDTPNVQETLNDITLVNGQVRIVWQASEPQNFLYGDIWGGLLDVPTVSARPCASGDAVELEAWRRYRPAGWFDDVEHFSTGFTFELPARLPVVEGEAGGKKHRAFLSFRSEQRLYTCEYSGDGDGYVFESCRRDDEGAGFGWGGACRYEPAEAGALVGALSPGNAVTVSKVKLHVREGAVAHGKTKVRVTLGGGPSCRSQGEAPGEKSADAPDVEAVSSMSASASLTGALHHGGCASAGGAGSSLLALLGLALRRRAH